MRNHFASFLSVVATTSLLFSSASCSDRHREVNPVVKTSETNRAIASAPTLSTVAETTAPSPTPVIAEVFADTSSTLEKIPRSEASTLTALSDKLNGSIEASLVAWKAGGGNSTTMTESKLSLARTDFTQKMRTLSIAGEDTWKNAKLEAASSLESVRVAYGKLIAGKGEE